MDISANLLQNGDELKGTKDIEKVIVKSSDGKLHDLVYNGSTKKLNFSLIDDKSRQLTLNINEILSIRSTKTKLHGGLLNTVSEDEPNHDIPNVLYIYYAYKHNIYIWRVRKAALYFSTTSEKKHWEALLKAARDEIHDRPKKLLIFINPYGGKRQAKSIYEKQVEPIFNLSGLTREVILTERANHAYDVIQELDDESWKAIDGIISVGGDGLFNEIMCSAIVRTQNESKIDITDLNIDNLTTPHMRFGIIPAGSANSIASSIHGVDDPATSAMHIAIGSKCPVDCCTIHEKNSLVRISANACSYGWLGEVMEDSEKFRCLGPIRYQVSALRTTIKHPTYFGRVSFALNGPEEKDLKIPECEKPCSICDGTEQPDPLQPYHWQTDFTHCICCVIPCVSPFSKWGIAPYAGVGDGTLDLALVGKVSRCENLKIMRTVSLYGGKELIPEQNQSLKLFRVSRFSFTPAIALGLDKAGASGNGKQGSWNVDGELIHQNNSETLSFKLRASLINYFGREVDLEDSRYQKCFCCYSKQKFSNIIVLG